MEKRHRIFIAINLPSAVKKMLVSHTKKWETLPAKWTEIDNLHITLVFLGELTDIEMADACNVVKEISQKHGSFEISLKKISYGPENKFKYVWVSGEKSKELSDLKFDLEESLLEKIRFRPEGREFTPHVTLARVQEWQLKQVDQEEIPEINEELDCVFTVESIEVMESDLKRGGPVYTILESHQLQ